MNLIETKRSYQLDPSYENKVGYAIALLRNGKIIPEFSDIIQRLEQENYKSFGKVLRQLDVWLLLDLSIYSLKETASFVEEPYYDPEWIKTQIERLNVPYNWPILAVTEYVEAIAKAIKSGLNEEERFNYYCILDSASFAAGQRFKGVSNKKQPKIRASQRSIYRVFNALSWGLRLNDIPIEKGISKVSLGESIEDCSIVLNISPENIFLDYLIKGIEHE